MNTGGDVRAGIGALAADAHGKRHTRGVAWG
jgi:hypothetical protein